MSSDQREQDASPEQPQETPAPVPARAAVPVVGIGGSSGALDSFERFFLSLPSGGGMAFVMVLRPQGNGSALTAELLQRCTDLPVREVTEDTELEPDQVYLVPPGTYALLSGSRLTQWPAPEGAAMPVDAFFLSLAEAAGQEAIAIVFAGGGHDGTEGLKAVLAAGGLTMVQAPGTAEYASMPLSAVTANAAQYVLPPEELAARLHTVVTRVPTLSAAELFPEEGRLSAPLQLILQQVRQQTGNDFTLYKQSTIMRRIHRRMLLHTLESVAQYARYLRDHPQEVLALHKDLTINVTQFFRDPDAFVSLKEQLRDSLLREDSERAALRAWIPGCATGEEAYSVAITLSELLAEFPDRPALKVQIFATDIDEDSLAVARSGSYSGQGVSGVSPERLERHFLRRGDQFVVRPELREMLVFAVHNTFGEPPFTRLDLLCCRNMLIYLNSDIQRQLIPLFHYALRPGALLFLGAAETVGASRPLFTPVDPHWKLYRRLAGPAQPLTTNFGRPGQLQAAEHERRPVRSPELPPSREAEIARRVTRALLDEYAAPAVAVTPSGEIAYVSGRTSPFLELAFGRPGTNVLEMVRDGLRHELSAALRSAHTGGRQVTRRYSYVGPEGAQNALDLIVRPLPHPDAPLLLVIFGTVTTTPLPEGQTDLISELRQELKYTRDYLEANIEEAEVSVERLKATNEELQTTNEELQSSNEELMTSKEELQSLNEELLTVNTEHQMTISDLAHASDDMKNLLDSAGIATVFLDNALRIKRFTPRITSIIPLIPSDVGRPLAHLTTNLLDAPLELDGQAVLRDLKPVEREVQTKAGQWFVMKSAPYRTFDNFIDGVVMVFTSITQLKRLQEENVQEEEDASGRPCPQAAAGFPQAAEGLPQIAQGLPQVAQGLPEPLAVLDTELRVLSSNQAFTEVVQLRAERVIDRPLDQLLDAQPSLRPLLPLLQGVAAGGAPLSQYAVPVSLPPLGPVSLSCSARRLAATGNAGPLVLLSMQDITALLLRAGHPGRVGASGAPQGEERAP